MNEKTKQKFYAGMAAFIGAIVALLWLFGGSDAPPPGPEPTPTPDVETVYDASPAVQGLDLGLEETGGYIFYAPPDPGVMIYNLHVEGEYVDLLELTESATDGQSVTIRVRHEPSAVPIHLDFGATETLVYLDTETRY